VGGTAAWGRRAGLVECASVEAARGELLAEGLPNVLYSEALATPA
jgi:hypothetical protein